MDKNKFAWVVLLILALAFAGCAGKQEMQTAADAAAEDLKAREAQIQKLESNMAKMEKDLAAAEAEAKAKARAAAEAEAAAQAAREAAQAATKTEPATTTNYSMSGSEMLPPNAKPGECYARVFVPPTYDKITERVLVREASERVETIPAKYEWGTEKVLVKEATSRIEVVPATYKWIEEKVLVKPASTKLEEVPATYDWVEEQVLVTPARTVWKEGRGPIERVDQSTGEIMCLVEEPAVYKTVRRKVVKTKATTRTVEVPAEYKTVKRQVVDKPATTRTIEVPAKYETVKVRKLVSPASEKRISIPEEWSTVTKNVQKSDGKMEWREILCQTNMSASTVRDVQRALKTAGYNPGPVDGVYGTQTREAVTAFQKQKGLATGGLTLSTLKALGVNL